MAELMAERTRTPRRLWIVPAVVASAVALAAQVLLAGR
jgi:hypothetical protein